MNPGPGWRRPPEGDLLLLHAGDVEAKHLLRRHGPPNPALAAAVHGVLDHRAVHREGPQRAAEYQLP